jgi:hypothetical protein
LSLLHRKLSLKQNRRAENTTKREESEEDNNIENEQEEVSYFCLFSVLQLYFSWITFSCIFSVLNFSMINILT